MLRNMSMGSNIIPKLAFVIVLVAVITVALNYAWNPPPSTVEITDCSLTASQIQDNSLTSIVFRIRSNDEDTGHEIRVELSSHELVTFMLGSQNLPREGDSWVYTETLPPSASHLQSINVKGQLEQGISKLDYRIVIKFYSDNDEIYRKNLDLTVERA